MGGVICVDRVKQFNTTQNYDMEEEEMEKNLEDEKRDNKYIQIKKEFNKHYQIVNTKSQDKKNKEQFVDVQYFTIRKAKHKEGNGSFNLSRLEWRQAVPHQGMQKVSLEQIN